MRTISTVHTGGGMPDRHAVMLQCMAGHHSGRKCAVIKTLDDDLSGELVRIVYLSDTVLVPTADVTLYATDGPNVTNLGLSRVH